MQFDPSYLKTTQGILKLFALIFIYMNLILKRFGGPSGFELVLQDLDAQALVWVTIGAYVIIHTVMLFFILFGEGMATRMVSSFILLIRVSCNSSPFSKFSRKPRISYWVPYFIWLQESVPLTLMLQSPRLMILVSLA